MTLGTRLLIGLGAGGFTPDTTAPTAPSNLTAAAASIEAIDLFWDASTDATGVAAYLIERCTGSACTDFAQIDTTPDLTYSDDAPLTPDTLYRYRVRARDPAGNLSSYSDIAEDTTFADVGEDVATFPGGGASTLAAFLTLMADMSYDAIEIETGTYHWASSDINIDRTSRPLTVRPASGATVVFDGDAASGGQFYFGLGGVARFIYLELADVVFTDYTLGDTGIIWLGNAKDMHVNGPTIEDVTVVGTGPADSWALYLSIDDGESPERIVANGWTVNGVAQNFSACQVGHPPSVMDDIEIRDWTVDSVSISLYAYGTVTNLLMDGWVITNSIRDDRPSTVFFGDDVSGTYSNNSSDLGDLEQVGGMTDGGGNSGL